jgi:hypothetical protein
VDVNFFASCAAYCSPEMMAPGYHDLGWHVDNQLVLFRCAESEEFFPQTVREEVDVD